MGDGDPLGDQVLPDHVDQVLARRELGGGAGGQGVGVEVRGAAELGDPLGHPLGVLLLLAGVLGELRLGPGAVQAARGDRMLGVAEHADQLGGQHALQDLDGLCRIAPVGLGHHRPVLEAPPRALA